MTSAALLQAGLFQKKTNKKGAEDMEFQKTLKKELVDLWKFQGLIKRAISWSAQEYSQPPRLGFFPGNIPSCKYINTKL